MEIARDLYLRLMSERGVLEEISHIVQTTKGTDNTLKDITEALKLYEEIKTKK